VLSDDPHLLAVGLVRSEAPHFLTQRSSRAPARSCFT
jgi:hypothetical protein